jgi:alpha-D-ribose 1-methylphosphonate 5-phosphate C-P lyase
MSAVLYAFAFVDDKTKRRIRRALLKAVALPGHQIPFASREMPMPYGWGTGGIAVTGSIIGPEDVLKVIEMGSDDTMNATNIRRLFERTAFIATTDRTADATIIQTRHRIPETPLHVGQTLVLQVSNPEPLSDLASGSAARVLHAAREYDGVFLRMYEDIATHGRVARARNYPVRVNDEYIMAPSSIPTFDNPKMHRSPALMLFAAGREKRLYAVPPWTKVESVGFEDFPFQINRAPQSCASCGAVDTFVYRFRKRDMTDVWLCSDTGACKSPSR